MPYWGGDGTDSLSKQTLEAWLCVLKLSDRFRKRTAVKWLLTTAAATATNSLQLLLRVTRRFAPGLPVSSDCQSRHEIIMHVPHGCFLTETMSCHVGFSAKLKKCVFFFLPASLKLTKKNIKEANQPHLSTLVVLDRIPWESVIGQFASML